MTLKFASKPNVNGHRMFLTVDTVNKVAEISHDQYYYKSDYITMSRCDMTALYNKFKAEFSANVTA